MWANLHLLFWLSLIPFVTGWPTSSLQSRIVAARGRDSVLAAALGLAFVNQWLADALFVFVAVLWLIPDRRIERMPASG